MALWVQCLLNNYEDQNSDAQSPCKISTLIACVCNPRDGRQEWEDPWGFLEFL